MPVYNANSISYDECQDCCEQPYPYETVITPCFPEGVALCWEFVAMFRVNAGKCCTTCSGGNGIRTARFNYRYLDVPCILPFEMTFGCTVGDDTGNVCSAPQPCGQAAYLYSIGCCTRNGQELVTMGGNLIVQCRIQTGPGPRVVYAPFGWQIPKVDFNPFGPNIMQPYWRIDLPPIRWPRCFPEEVTIEPIECP
jgi:hypothetical protein